ncbi:hypothetical protein [Paraburkholderia terrae]|uniref:hypothetical protein n=1 Tax=Paraburkholderia terrae TaxID=311230 RepID=UPI00205EE5B2|nr:hypothetical protein [Paraburkholderia terrae]BDC37727.1 hypothetical protein PTKU15_10240 [Paraburkholderia terrae]
MLKLTFHADAAQELRALRTTDPDNYYSLVAILDEIRGDQRILAKLTEPGVWKIGSGKFDITKYSFFWNSGFDVWRIKTIDFEQGVSPYRVLYAYDWKQQYFHVLAIMPRHHDYQNDKDLTERLLKAYRELGISIN